MASVWPCARPHGDSSTASSGGVVGFPCPNICVDAPRRPHTYPLHKGRLLTHPPSYDTEHKISYPPNTREHYEMNNWLFFQNAGVGPMQGQASTSRLLSMLPFPLLSPGWLRGRSGCGCGMWRAEKYASQRLRHVKRGEMKGI